MSAIASPAAATFDGVTVDFDSGRLWDPSGAEIELRPQSLAVLRRLARTPGVVVSKDDLVAAVWRGVAVTDDSLVLPPRIGGARRRRRRAACPSSQFCPSTNAAMRDPAETETYHRMRGSYYRLMGRYAESIGEYRALAAPQFNDHLSLALDHVRMGQMAEARAQAREALAMDPAFTLAMWRDGTVSSDPTVLDGEIADLAAAGLPE